MTRKTDYRLLGILSTLMGFASISTDLYLPAMPAIGRELGAKPGDVAFTISGYLIGFSLGQLVWGPIGDRYGRRRPIGLGVVFFAIGSAGCALADSIESLIFWRVVQALGASASVVLGRAMVRDLYEGNRAAQMMSTLLTVMAIAPLLGPLVGGQILHFAGWRAIFWALVVIGALTFAALFTISETLPIGKRNDEPLARAFGAYRELLRNRALLGYAGVGGFFYAGNFAYLAGSPFAYIAYYRVSAQAYGLLFASGVLGIMGANLCNAWAVHRVGLDGLLRLGACGAALSGSVLAIDARTHAFGLAGLAVPSFCFITMMGFIVANAIAGALALSPRRSGIASALIGSIQYGSGILGSASVGFFADGTPWPFGCVVAICGIGCLLCTLLVSLPAAPVPAGEATIA